MKSNLPVRKSKFLQRMQDKIHTACGSFSFVYSLIKNEEAML